MKEKWLNRIALVSFVLVMVLWAWWLFHPQPMPFVLRARWKVQGFVIGGIAFSPKGDWLAASVWNFQQGQSTVQLWQVPKTQTNPKVFSVSQQVQPNYLISSSFKLGFSPDGRLLAVGYLSRAWARSPSLPSLKVAGCKRSRWAKADWSLLSPSPPMGDWQLSLTTDFGSFGLMTAKRCH
jgi:WD40 repeat protein